MSNLPYVKIYNDDDSFNLTINYLFEKEYLNNSELIAKIK